ncbi:MAG: glycosyltransferase family 2 protein [Methanobrevibacter sp.]|uniref:glycosyltransferase family 2 protein n=1 Tax=Methanobrevibacter sp. TaxID=66852 RepID=UPI0025DB692F|nr:glycosyltransferase family 2 protein [Methanobrevibacter sp.]MBQ8018108.1 glycosyltransferase family 2 protein [Methanobrevibacter sp.]
MKSIVIVPALNEEAAIGQIVEKSLKYVDDVLVIDDGSSDNTSIIAEKSGARVIKHPTNLGKGVSLKDAFSEVSGYDIVVTIDGDGQHNPDEIPELINPIKESQADLVNGSRYLDGFDEETPAYRRVGQRVLDIATNITSGTHVTDSQSGFRAFNGNTIKYYRFRDTGFGIESEMLADAAEHDLKIMEVPITVRYDVENSSTKGPITHGVGVLMKIVIDKIIRTLRR